MQNYLTQLKSTKAIGDKFEKIAREYLKQNQVLLLERNYSSKSGEIDIIGQQDNTLLFIEVRSRSNTHFGTPEETITPKKQQRIRRTAEKFLQTNSKYRHTLCRFDVISITYSESDHSILWIKNAF